MITALLLVLAQAATATPAPAPKLGGGFGQTKPPAATARVVITDQTLAPTGRGRGAFSVAGAPIARPLLTAPAAPPDEGRAAAQRRMDAAVNNGAWVLNNTRHNWQIWDEARREWNAAAENCRKTDGCVPHYKPDWAFPIVVPDRP